MAGSVVGWCGRHCFGWSFRLKVQLGFRLKVSRLGVIGASGSTQRLEVVGWVGQGTVASAVARRRAATPGSSLAAAAPKLLQAALQRSGPEALLFLAASGASAPGQPLWESRPDQQPPQSTANMGAPLSRSALGDQHQASRQHAGHPEGMRGRIARAPTVEISHNHKRARAGFPPKWATMALVRTGAILSASITVGPTPPGGIGSRRWFRVQWLRRGGSSPRWALWAEAP